MNEVSNRSKRVSRQSMFRTIVAISSLLLPFSTFAQSPIPLSTPDLNLVVEGSVQAIIRQPDGSVIIGGDFSSVNGLRRTNLARIAPEGILDPNWAPAIGFPVRAIAAARDGTDSIFVGGGGAFLPYGPTRLHRVFGFGIGEVDQSWAPEIDGRVDAIAVDLSGNVFVGGTFFNVDGELRQCLAKFRTNMSPALDPEWTPATASGVASLLLDDKGSIYLGGDFSQVNGEPRARLAKLLSDGEGVLDASWNPGANASVTDLESAAGGSMYAAGAFTQIGGKSLSRIAMLSADGVVDQAWNPVVDKTVLDLSRGEDGVLYLGGLFTQIDGVPALRVARLVEKGGTIDATWTPTVDMPVVAVLATPSGGAWIGGLFTRVNEDSRLAAAFIDAAGATGNVLDVEKPGKVWAIQLVADGAAILGGDFIKIDGEERRNLARVDSNGALDLVWNPRVDREIFALAMRGTSLFVGGEFPPGPGDPQGYLAKIATVGEGAIDEAWSPSTNGRVEHIELSTDDSIFIAGKFSAVDSLPRAGLAKIGESGSGIVDALWDPQPTGEIHALAVDDSGALYVGGSLSGVGGSSAANIAKLEGSGIGAANASWTSSVNYTVRDIELNSTGDLFIGGDFTFVDDESMPGLAKLSGSDGLLNPNWRPDVDGLNSARALAYSSSNNALYAAGVFDGLSGYPRSFLKMDAGGSGEIDPKWNPSGEAVSFLKFDVTEGLYVGGAFDHVSWVARNGIARLPLEAGDSGFANGFERY